MAHQFVAHIGDGVKLTEEVQRQIAADVQKAVVNALAKLDLRGDLTTTVPRELVEKFPEHTQGIWVDPQRIRQF